MIILGIHFGHDGAACVVKDGRLVSALSSERLSRQKKSHGIRDDVIDAVLETAGVRADQIDAVALSDYHSAYVHGTMEVRWNGQDSSYNVIPDTWNRIFDNEVLEQDVLFRGRLLPGYNVGHHMCHMAAAYYTSPFDDAFCVSMDSSGGYTKTNFGLAHGIGSNLTAVTDLSCLVGLAYGEFTELLGLGSQMFKAGSLMALAGYGQVLPHARAAVERYCSESLFEHPSGDYRKWVADLWKEIAGAQTFTKESSDGDSARNIAASIQFVFDACVLSFVNGIQAGGCKNICLGGGSFLNCNVNSKVHRESQFSNVHLFPACSDDGCAVGAALYTAFNVVGEENRTDRTYEDGEICYLGPERAGTEPDYGRIVDLLVQEKVIAWVDGRSEYGPRALGHRSLLADPRVYGNRERINSGIKNREWFRPLSPSVLEEDAANWFDFPVKSPFMLFTAPARNPDDIPAVVHVDGTARMQTVTEDLNPHYYRLIREFKDRTAVPMLLNTSLNGSDEPIVESTEDAWRFFDRGTVDAMVLDGVLYER